MSISRSPAHKESTDVATSEELARHVRAWRLRLQPDAVPDAGLGWSRRRRRYVSQERVAQLVNCSAQWYARLELGRLQNYAPDFLNAVAHVLRLDHDEKRLLFLLVGRQPPTPICRATAEDLQPVLAAQPFPAYLSDHAWDVVGSNERMRWLLPFVAQPDANVMRWVFTDPDARHRLHQWDTDWAPKMLAQLRAAHVHHPQDQALRDLIRELLHRSPEARRLWEKPMAYFHPDGDRRWIVPPDGTDPCLVHLVALEPLRLPRHRLIMLLPVDD